jgi:hypothetical protein
MSHQDADGRKVRFHADYLRQALQWLLGKAAWETIRFRQDCTWAPRHLAAAALLWAWSDEATLDERFHTARKITAHLDPPQQELAASYQAFLKLLRRWTARFRALLQTSLRRRMQETFSEPWLVFGFALFGVDGSRVELPRTKSHEAVYAPSAQRPRKRQRRRKQPRTAAHAKTGRTPQMWLTTLWHAGTGLPWDWRLGSADSSEREHWKEMLPQLPENALVAADAGFVGYEYAQAVIASGRHLLVRVGANVRLLRQLGYGRERAGLVYLWPDRQAKEGQPPLVLRLVIAQGGKHPVYLVTSVLDPKRLSDAQVIEVYRRRWGIELFYRHLKQTFQRRKLRSASAENARVEMEWSLLGLWGMGLYAQAELTRAGIAPRRLSVAKMLRAFRRMLRDYRHPAERGTALCSLLRHALIDDYPRTNKTSRDYPRKKQEKPPGAPQIQLASPAQVALAQELRAEAQKGLSA